MLRFTALAGRDPNSLRDYYVDVKQQLKDYLKSKEKNKFSKNTQKITVSLDSDISSEEEEKATPIKLRGRTNTFDSDVLM